MRIDSCTLCPRRCGVPRESEAGHGFCGMGADPVVARAALHHWEEPCISGTRGSGTVFFSGCTLRCVYCQNSEISRGRVGNRVTPEALAQIFRNLEAQGAHNINLVSPTPFVPAILDALRRRKPGIPVVYNCGGYERVETLRLLAGWVDIYLPDYKYQDAQAAFRYSGAANYPDVVGPALAEMRRQTGPARYDGAGLMTRGTLIRHLILPGQPGQAQRVANRILEALPSGTPVSFMSQYTPTPGLPCPELNRRITPREARLVASHLRAIGLLDGYVQQADAANAAYVPVFDGTGVPDTT